MPGRPPVRPTSHPLVKGALITKKDGTKTSSIFFQYNPVTLTRSLKPSFYGEGGPATGSLRFSNPPAESLELDIRLDATDQLTAGTTSPSTGVRPMLAALSLLTYAKTSDIRQRDQKLAQGKIEVVPADAPQLLFVFGESRVVPVKLDSMNVTEELFNNALTPIRATVKLTMTVMSHTSSTDANYQSYSSYQQGLEQSAQQYQAPEGQEQLVSDV